MEEDNEPIPDQRLFEPEPIEDEAPRTGWQRVWPYLRAVVAAVVVVGLLYVSGVYQALLLRETPDDIEQTRLSPAIEGPTISIPVRVIFVRGDESVSTSRENREARKLVRNAGNIFAQARIDLTLKEVQTVTVSSKEVQQFLREPRAFMVKQPVYDEHAINVFLTGTLSGLNGVAFGGTSGLAVADVTSHYDFRTLAHEVGHILSLGHRSDPTALMSQASFGTDLNHDEIRKARRHAQGEFSRGSAHDTGG